jgi:PKD repeat protein
MNQTTRTNRMLAFSLATFLSLISLCAGTALAAEKSSALGINAPLQNHKLRIRDPALVAEVASKGGSLVADYGAFQLFQVDEAVLGQMAGRPGFEDVTEQNIIMLNTKPLNTTEPEVMGLRGGLVATSGGNQLHLVQFVGPIKPEWYAALEQTGVKVVAYIPYNSYLVYGDSLALGRLQSWAGGSAYIQWEGAYLNEYRIDPAARLFNSKGDPQKPSVDTFIIQMVADPAANSATLAAINGLKLDAPREVSEFLGYVNVVVRIPPQALPQIAAQPDVVSIQPYPEPTKKDERQDQIMAGNLTGSGPSGPGYLAWLGTKGFTQAQFTASGFAIDLSDSGIDNGTTSPGHFGLYLSGNSALASRVIYNRLVGTPNSGSTIQGCDGHGNLNSHIMAGYNDQPVGFPHTDSAGYHYGLGICPFVKVGSSVIFDPNTFTSPNIPNLQSMAYNDGARISGNSWGAAVSGAYNANSQAYDALVRDAQPAGSTFPTAGNQQMVIVFAAGNSGSGASTIGAPGTAKNVFTIAAAENVHSHSIANGGNSANGNDGCAITDTGADNANDIISFSSRGPCTDGRKKPDISGPGTHVTGGVGQTSPPPAPGTTGSALACFAGSGVCALPGGGTIGSASNFFPINQQFYTTSSGTSHSTPAVAGCCALLRQYFINTGLTPPSPAMSKAYLMNSARYMNGVGANDTLPSNNQGMGEMNLSVAFDGTARVLRDQLGIDKFTATGQTRTYVGTISDSGKPFRVTLAWTDAPGATTGNAYNNDLDLTVTAGGNTYKGNVFTGANSVTGGAADSKDNVESVFLPAGVSGTYVVTVTAANIVSDGVPNEAPALDQDFALVTYNAIETPTPVISTDTGTIIAESCIPTNNVPDPGETITMLLGLKNVGSSNTFNVTATMAATNGVSAPSGPQNYGALSTNGATVFRSFTFVVTAGCGQTIQPTLHVQDGALDLGNVSFAIQLGQPNIPMGGENFDGVSAPALPAGWTTVATGAQSNWVSSTTSSDTAPNSVFARDPAAAGGTELVGPIINQPLTQLSFRHKYELELGWDGGVLEISINGGAFTDILTAGGSFVTGGYRQALNSSANPLTGRQAWTGTNANFSNVVVNLPASASGQPVQFKWRCGADASVGRAGWFVDSIQYLGVICCGTLAPPTSLFTGAPTSGIAPLTVTFTDTSTGTITNRSWDFGNGGTTNTTATTFNYTYNTPGTNTVILTTTGPLGSNSLSRPAYIVVTNLSPVIVPNGLLLAGETCTNGAADPGESITVSFGIRNVGGGASTNLVATLLAANGVTAPGGPANYGAILPGATASRSFTFVPVGPCGGIITATLQLQDGASSLGTVSFPIVLGTVVTTLAENFDGAAPPALPAGWSTAASGAQSNWVTTVALADSAPNSAFSPDVPNVGDNQLVTPSFVPTAGAVLSFRHNYILEAGTAPSAFDGGVLEISINGSAFSDIITAGGSFITNGYNRTISSSFNSPIAGRQAWSSSSGGFITTLVNLPPSAAGQPTQLQWRCATDSSLSATGWYVDTIQITTYDCCLGPPILLSPALLPDGRLTFIVSGPAGYNYSIEQSTDVSFSNWTAVDVLTNPTGQVPFTETNAPGDPFRAFRAHRLP